jgi:hypothetical protein
VSHKIGWDLLGFVVATQDAQDIVSMRICKILSTQKNLSESCLRLSQAETCAARSGMSQIQFSLDSWTFFVDDNQSAFYSRAD